MIYKTSYYLEELRIFTHKVKLRISNKKNKWQFYRIYETKEFEHILWYISHYVQYWNKKRIQIMIKIICYEKKAQILNTTGFAR